MLLLISTARFNDMECIALVLSALKRHNHRNFVVLILDHVFEQVLRGIEENDFKDAQRRVSVMKFLAECYNYKVIHTDALFSLLYRLINWDIYTNVPDERMAALDSLDDCFRIRLVCTLLDSLGKFFNKGKRALLMDRFLIFFQRYILMKHYILMDLEFMILDTFDNVKRKTPKLSSLEEAN
jgi:regulator of nonsense transcripts 2